MCCSCYLRQRLPIIIDARWLKGGAGGQLSTRRCYRTLVARGGKGRGGIDYTSAGVSVLPYYTSRQTTQSPRNALPRGGYKGGGGFSLPRNVLATQRWLDLGQN